MTWRWFIVLIVAEAIAIALLKWPNLLLFEAYAFGDQGANLAADRLIVEGWLPGTDFNYLYGSLSLAVGRMAFGSFGCTPLVYALVTTAMAVGVAAMLAGIALVVKVPLAGRVFILAVLPLVVPQLPQLNFAHSVEGLMLATAIYLQARGKDRWALVAVTIAVLAKPALGFVYGLILLIRLGVFPNPGEGPWRSRFVRSLFPAAISGGAILVILAGCFGIESITQTLLPLKAREVYRQEGFGFFFGSGRQFWQPVGANWRYYLGTSSGFWLAATVYLAIAVVASANRARDLLESSAAGVVVSCGVLHVSFVLFGFGNNYSWTYYSYLLIAGVVASTACFTWSRRLGWAFVAIAALGQYSEMRGILAMWRDRTPASSMDGLYATDRSIDEWGRLRGLAESRRVFVLTYLGASFTLDSGLDSTRAWCFYPWMATDREWTDLLARVDAADIVAITKHNLSDIKFQPRTDPRLKNRFVHFPYVVEWTTMTLYFRKPPT